VVLLFCIAISMLISGVLSANWSRARAGFEAAVFIATLYFTRKKRLTRAEPPPEKPLPQ